MQATSWTSRETWIDSRQRQLVSLTYREPSPALWRARTPVQCRLRALIANVNWPKGEVYGSLHLVSKLGIRRNVTPFIIMTSRYLQEQLELYISLKIIRGSKDFGITMYA
jgi:hypothetical protein